MVPVFLFELSTATIVSVLWGFSILTILSYIISKDERKSSWKMIVEHLVIALIVVLVTHYIGDWVYQAFS